MKSIGYNPISLLLLAAILAAAALFWRPWAAPEPLPPFQVALVRLTAVDAQTVTGFKTAMAAAGYREGETIRYLDQGPAGSIDRLDAIIEAHLREQPDLFLVSSTPATQAVQRMTRGNPIPIVFAPVNDPLAAGIVDNLKHPGGQITGVRLPTGDDLRLYWLREIAPRARRVWVPYTPEDRSAHATLAQIRDAAPGLGLDLLEQPVSGKRELNAALAAMPADVDAIFLPRDSSIESHIELFVEFALQRRLPLSAPSLIQVEAGALFSYGFVHGEIGQQAAHLAEQIIKGVSPGDLPVQMAENVLSINLATARRIGIDVPDTILLQAERIVRE
jgi:putative tryptophan/tyrosine transport system substrate-binding protein